MPVTPIISLSDVYFSYGNTVALSRVNCTLYAGEYIAIIGPNGGGKSTFLRLLLGLETADKGTIEILGTSPIVARNNGVIGYVPQRIPLANDMIPATVLEVIETGLLHTATRNKKQIILDTVQLVGIEPLLHRQCNQLSGGQLQLVYMARALVSTPRILLLDEPASGIDALYKKELYRIIKHLQSTGVTVLFVSHEVDDIVKEADKVLCINQTVCCHTSSHDFIQKHTITSLYQTALTPAVHA